MKIEGYPDWFDLATWRLVIISQFFFDDSGDQVCAGLE